MIPWADLIGRGYRRDGMGPTGPLSCLGVSMILMARHGIPLAAQEPAGSLQVEATLAAWANAADGPWEALEPVAAERPRDGDVLLLDTPGDDPAGLAVVADGVQGLAVTSLPGRGVCALKVRTLRPTVRQVYRWRAPVNARKRLDAGAPA